MKKENIKIQRINSDIYRALAVAIDQLDDDNIFGVTVTNTQTSADLGSCKVFVSIDTTDENEEQRVFTALQASAGFLRTLLAADLNLKHTPQIRFFLDKGKANAIRVEELLEQINAERGKK